MNPDSDTQHISELSKQLLADLGQPPNSMPDSQNKQGEQRVVRFRKKPVVIEAMRFTDESKDRCFNWVSCNRYASNGIGGEPTLVIQTLEGEMTATLGDWIIKGVKGEFYPCKPDILEATYEAESLFSQQRAPSKDQEERCEALLNNYLPAGSMGADIRNLGRYMLRALATELNKEREYIQKGFESIMATYTQEANEMTHQIADLKQQLAEVERMRATNQD